VRAKVREQEHEKEKWEGRNGDGDKTLTTCSTLNFIQNLDGLYFVQWWIKKFNMTFLVMPIFYRKKWWMFNHYNNRGLFCDPNIIAKNKERCFRNPAVANHNSSQTLKLLRYHNIRTRTIASPSQLPNLIQSQNFSDYNCIYPLFVINITSETICSKPITVTT
jgi:hypothetical protein